MKEDKMSSRPSRFGVKPTFRLLEAYFQRSTSVFPSR
nr:MAG TPA: hypothetical protein [Caudoviricetes sp.]